MRVIDPGHEFELSEIDNSARVQRLTFVKRVGENYPGNSGAHGGILTQEALRAIISRCKYMNAQGHCVETDQIIHSLRMALYAFEVRAARCRGTWIELKTLEGIEDIPVCLTCGHIQCDQSRHTREHWSKHNPITEHKSSQQ